MDQLIQDEPGSDLKCGIVVDHGMLTLQEVREAIEAVLREQQGTEVDAIVPCQCGGAHRISGLWYMVADKLEREPLIMPQVFLRCEVCGNISTTDGFDQLAGVMSFFQAIPTESGGIDIEEVSYDLGGLEGFLKDVLPRPE